MAGHVLNKMYVFALGSTLALSWLQSLWHFELGLLLGLYLPLLYHHIKIDLLT